MDAHPYSITPAGKADIPALVQLVNSAYRGEDGQQGWTQESHLISGSRTTPAGIEELLQTPDAVILKCTDRNDALQGCVYLHKENGKLYLGMLSVWPALQNTGIGKLLLRTGDEYAARHQCSAIRITVISLRTELVAWYERHGYVRTGEIESFHAGDKFGIIKQPLELAVLEKPVPAS